MINPYLMRAYSRLIIGVLSIVVVLLSLHWYMITALPGAATVRAAYLYRYRTRDNWPWFDIYFPMFALALVTARQLYKLHYLHTVFAILVELTVLLGLLALYATELSPSICYWWPHEARDVVPFLHDQFLHYVLFFQAAALVMRLGYRNETSNRWKFDRL
jgi:hypothetical protein